MLNYSMVVEKLKMLLNAEIVMMFLNSVMMMITVMMMMMMIAKNTDVQIDSMKTNITMMMMITVMMIAREKRRVI